MKTSLRHNYEPSVIIWLFINNGTDRVVFVQINCIVVDKGACVSVYFTRLEVSLLERKTLTLLQSL